MLKPAEKRKEYRIGVLHFILPSWKSKEMDREKIIKDFEADRDKRKKDVAEWHSTEEGKKQKELHWMKCPKDGSDLKETNLTHNLFVDDCTLCRGIFLDYGELEDISKLSDKERREIRDRILELSINPGESASGTTK